MALSKPAASVVIALTGTELSEAVVSSIIDDAALIAAACLEPKSDEVQASALKWLAAHLIASTSDQESKVVTSTKLGDASDTFGAAQLSNGIMGTTYGQQAVALAPCLARLGRARAKITVV